MKYTTCSAYTRNISHGYQLGKKYMKLSEESLREDEMAIKMRKSRLNLENIIKKNKEKNM